MLAGYILVALATTRLLLDLSPRRLLVPIGSTIGVALLVEDLCIQLRC